MTTGHTKWFCFGPNCYAPNVTVSLNTLLSAGDTAELLAYCAPNDSEGVSIINYEIFDANGNSDTISFTFTYSFTLAGITEVDFANNFLNIYPNPAKDRLNIDLNTESFGQSIVEFIDATGRLVSSEIINRSGKAYQKDFNLSNFAKGLYIVRVTNNNKCLDKKLIIQ